MAKRKSARPGTLEALTSFSSWSARISSSQIWAPASLSVASTIDLTLRSSGMFRNSATCSHLTFSGVKVLTRSAFGAARSATSGSASAASMLAA
ncbi:hypothetical protein D3C81_1771350 [compost metagenome]